MSESAVLDYVKTKIAAIASPGAAGTLTCVEGIPHEGMPSDIGVYPLCVLTVRNGAPEPRGFGVAGNTIEHYTVEITLFLGTKEMSHVQATAWAKLFPSRFRAAFSPDWKLGGNAMDSDLSGAVDNLKIQESGNALYQDAGQYPMQGYDLDVQESVAANAVAP